MEKFNPENIEIDTTKDESAESPKFVETLKKSRTLIALCTVFASMYPGDSEAKDKYQNIDKQEMEKKMEGLGIPKLPDMEFGEIVMPGDAKKIIILIKQSHLVSDQLRAFRESSSEKITTDLEEVLTCQKQIYTGILKLKENLGINTVHTEGWIKETEMECKKILATNPNDYFASKVIPHISEGPLKGKREISNELFEKYKLAAGAPEVLASEKNISVKAAETRKANVDAFQYVEMMDQKNLSEKKLRDIKTFAFTNREDAAISIASKAEGKFVVIVYGAEHNFGDNVETFNQKNARSKVGLVTYVPNSVKHVTPQ